ncbi:MAG: hypothetical protein Q9200_001629 [Gallowayella weberi]
MEPLSLLSTVSHVIQLSTRASRLRHAPVAIAELANELERFKVMIDALGDQPLENMPLRTEVHMAEVTIKRITKLLSAHAPNDQSSWPKAVSKLRWVAKDQEKAENLLQNLASHTTRIGILINAETMRSIRQHNNIPDIPETIIAVMGVTGSGKSRLIQRITQSTEVIIGHTLNSETQDIQAYPITVDDRVITLIDTPGFDDTFIKDVEVLEALASWLTKKYKSSQLLSGIIYLHPITDSRVRGSTAKSLEVFQRLVGPDSFHNIVLVTTMWDLLPDKFIGEAREEMLREEFWRPLIEKGSVTDRSYGDRRSALAVMQRVAFDQKMAKTSGAPLKIQREIVDEHRPLEATSAGEVLARRLDEIERKYKEQIQSIESKNRLERDWMQEEIEKLREEQIKLKTRHTTTQVQPSSNESKVTSISANISLRIGANDLLEVDAPPPYAPRESTVLQESLSSFRDIVKFSLDPIIQAYRVSTLMIGTMLRPRLQKGHTRIEWRCTCGDILYGDYLERSPGSLQNLVVELGGRVISRPSLERIPPVPSSSPAPPPPQVYFQGQSSGSSLVERGQGPNSNRTSNLNEGPNVNAGAVDVDVIQQPVIPPKWLELCIRSSSDTYRLGEIDVSGRQTDQTVFHKIKQKYETSRSTVRLFRRLALRIPNGGVFVQFRKDKLATPRNTVATASVMARPSVPKPQEARDHNYIFDPIPMDEPPIDSRTFNHYFHKPHLGDPSVTWIKRFPQLQDSSLFYSNEKLAKGWGIEITEDRNWILFVCANLMALMLSGTIAGLYIFLAKDAQTGVAIGAWLSAVQTLGVNGLFWHWTNQ